MASVVFLPVTRAMWVWRLWSFVPLGDGVLQELLEGERAGELIGGGEDDVGQVAEFVEGVEDVVVMQLAQRGVIDAEELVTNIVTIVRA